MIVVDIAKQSHSVTLLCSISICANYVVGRVVRMHYHCIVVAIAVTKGAHTLSLIPASSPEMRQSEKKFILLPNSPLRRRFTMKLMCIHTNLNVLNDMEHVSHGKAATIPSLSQQLQFFMITIYLFIKLFSSAVDFDETRDFHLHN